MLTEPGNQAEIGRIIGDSLGDNLVKVENIFPSYRGPEKSDPPVLFLKGETERNSVPGPPLNGDTCSQKHNEY